MNDNKNRGAAGLPIIILVLVVGFLAYLVFRTNAQQNQTSEQSAAEESSTSDTPTPYTVPCISPQQTRSYVGQFVCVTYYVGDAEANADGNVFLNESSDWQNGFSVYIPASVAQTFAFRDANGLVRMVNPYWAYGDRYINVSGIVQLYRGAPEIVISSQTQITYAQQQ